MIVKMPHSDLHTHLLVYGNRAVTAKARGTCSVLTFSDICGLSTSISSFAHDISDGVLRLRKDILFLKYIFSAEVGGLAQRCQVTGPDCTAKHLMVTGWGSEVSMLCRDFGILISAYIVQPTS